VRSDGDDERLYGIAQENRLILTREIKQQIAELLGEEYFLFDLNIQQGSVEFWIMIGTRAVQLLNGFSRYDALLKSFDKLTDQIKKIVQRLFSDDIPNRAASRLLGAQVEPDAEAVWIPGESVIASAERYSAQRTVPSGVSRILLYYLIASHSVLMAVLIWIVIRLIH